MVPLLVPSRYGIVGQNPRPVTNDPSTVRFADLMKVCQASLWAPRHASGSRVIFKMPWPGDPRVNLQNDRGKAKAYQVRQVLAAIDKLQEQRR